jgi:hypothetical protein
MQAVTFAFDVHDPRWISLLGHGLVPTPPPARRPAP